MNYKGITHCMTIRESDASTAQPRDDTRAIDPPFTLEHWVRQLNDREMPAFARTTDLITHATHSSETSATQLAKEILQDPTMTVRVLKMANNIFHNPKQRVISTVNRAIVILGFDTVRSICLSLAIVDNMLSATNKQNLLRELARSFHAATQARTLAIKRKDPSPEEVYIATLLYHLGRVVFWCFADRFDKNLSKAMDASLKKPGYSAEQAEQEVLGFTLQELSASLNREWHLNPLLEKALDGKVSENPRISNIHMSYELADRSEKGWERPETRETIQRIAESLYMPVRETTKLLQGNAEEARVCMQTLGAGKASKHIRMPAYTDPENPGIEPSVAAASDNGNQADAFRDQQNSDTREQQYLRPDRELQLTILTELSDIINDRPDINQILEMVLEGIYRGIGMDRTVFALLSRDRKAIRAKYVLGWDRIKINEEFHFRVSPVSTQSIIDYVLTTRKSLRVPWPVPDHLQHLITPEITVVTGKHPFFMCPVIINNKPIGLFYADRKPSGREMDEESYSSFNLFCQQANRGLSNL